MSLNLFLSFLWREWRDSPQMKSFFLRKMNAEFSDLMQGKAASKLIEQITIEELSLGTSLPVIKGELYILFTTVGGILQYYYAVQILQYNYNYNCNYNYNYNGNYNYNYNIITTVTIKRDRKKVYLPTFSEI